jgi:hypothetical protein
MRRTKRMSRLAFVAALLAFAAAAEIASAGDIELGPVRRFADERSARAACAPDGVVWADAATGFFYPRFHPDYAKSPHGAFTCYLEAKKADYWSLTPDGEEGHKGREFPLFFCYTCS